MQLQILCNYFRGALLANASNPDCIEGFGAQHVCNGKKECIGMRDELDCGKPNCMMVSYLHFRQEYMNLSIDFPTLFSVIMCQSSFEFHGSWAMISTTCSKITFKGFWCGEGDNCLLENQICDGVPNCRNGQDEKMCAKYG